MTVFDIYICSYLHINIYILGRLTYITTNIPEKMAGRHMTRTTLTTFFLFVLIFGSSNIVKSDRVILNWMKFGWCFVQLFPICLVTTTDDLFYCGKLCGTVCIFKVVIQNGGLRNSNRIQYSTHASDDEIEHSTLATGSESHHLTYFIDKGGRQCTLQCINSKCITINLKSKLCTFFYIIISHDYVQRQYSYILFIWFFR